MDITDGTKVFWGYSPEEREQLIQDIMVATNEDNDRKLWWRSDTQLEELADCLVLNEIMTRDQIPPGRIYVPRGTQVVYWED